MNLGDNVERKRPAQDDGVSTQQDKKKLAISNTGREHSQALDEITAVAACLGSDDRINCEG